MQGQPADDTIILAGDFNRKLLDGTDSIRGLLDSSISATELSYLPDAASRTCWHRDDFVFEWSRLSREARANNPRIDAQGVEPWIYTPESNQGIDFFVMRCNFGGATVSSDQVELPDLYRFINPGNTITACDGEIIVTFEGEDRALVFAEAFPSDHCPIVMNIELAGN